MYLKKPETIKFDPSIKEHRQAVSAFMKRRAWSDSALRFTHDPMYGSVSEQVQLRLVEYYIGKEFNKVRKPIKHKVVPTLKKAA